MNYLSTNEIVWQQTGEQAARLRGLLEQGIVPYAEFFRDERGAQDPGVRSYAAELRHQAERIISVASAAGDLAITSVDLMTVRTLPSDKIGEAITRANDSPYVDQVMAFSPMNNFDEHAARISPPKDLDRMNPATTEAGDKKGPLTPRAVRKVLDFFGLLKPDLKTVLQGRGVTVGSHVDRDLQTFYGDQGYKENVTVITKENSHLLEEKVREADVVILAAGRSEPSFTPEMARDGLAVVGVGRTDVDPMVYELDDVDVSVTPPHRHPQRMGVGSLTAVEAWDEIFAAAAERAARIAAERVSVFDPSAHPSPVPLPLQAAPVSAVTAPGVNGHNYVSLNGHPVEQLVPSELAVV